MIGPSLTLSLPMNHSSPGLRPPSPLLPKERRGKGEERSGSAARTIQFGLALWLCAGTARAAAPDAAGLEFFEKRIRPVLIENCYKCHSKEAEKPKGGLLLDSREGLLKGGDTGPGIVPGSPEKSLLIKAVRYTDNDLQMPPKNKKLAAGQVADLEAWVKMGAPDPRTADAVASHPPLSDPAKVKNHWAFKSVMEPVVPKVRTSKFEIRNPIDSFVLAKLEAAKWSPSPAADKRTLVRRASFDLTGLPPSPAEVEAFIADKSPDAFAKVVDRLLASPHYGERWARHWLDVARYADTKGYLAGDEQRRFAFSYTYRDYVINALNDDLPYDRFLLEQLAADLLPLGEDKRPLAALGFLTLGRRFLNNQNDIIDDRIDVVTRGTMGLTVTCARCHDHKYDPIPTKDYYSLHGVFASCSEPAEKPLLGVNPPAEFYNAYLSERAKREAELKDYHDKELDRALAEVRRRSGDYLLASHDAKGVFGRGDKFFAERKLDQNTVRRWQGSLAEWGKAHHPVFAPWLAFAALPEAEFAMKARELAPKFAANEDAARPLNPLVARLFSGEPPASLKQVAERYGKLLVESDAATSSSDKDREALRLALRAEGAPANLPVSESDSLLEGARPRLRQLKAKVDEVDAVHPGVPPRAMALQDNPTPTRPHVLIRGSPGNVGPEVPRQFLEVVAGPGRKPFEKGSGRLEMAQAIASRDNPLTARVIVNRVWLHHFGAGLVRTPSDFGLRADPPTHPELLDWLASRFVADGWSPKKLHKLILLSSTWQQSSDDRPVQLSADPANLLLWKQNRQRLEFEAMRDTLLAIAGKLDPAVGGRAVDIVAEPFATRRSVYGFIDRQNLPGLFRTFDFASPDVSTPQRFVTTVPQQALFLMNSPFVQQQARGLVERADFISLTKDEQRVRHLFALAYQRAPAPDEVKAALAYVQAQAAPGAALSGQAGWHYGWGEFDAEAKRVKSFSPLPHFTGSAWQGGVKMPDDILGWALLNAEGGHAGNDLQHAVVRRWVAPRDGTVDISGTFSHRTDKGDGVRGRIVSSRAGLLGEWVVHNNAHEAAAPKVEVKEGDTVDFVTDCRGDVGFDTFFWSPRIKYAAGASRARGRMTADTAQEWSAATDFGKPGREQALPMSAWEKYAQVILLSNEVAFVD